jgi:hypothetical protein
MTQSVEIEATEVVTTIEESEDPRKPVLSLPLVGATRVEDLAFYGALGAVTVFKFVSWPTAAFIGTAHALHQRAHNLRGRRGEFLEGTLEVTEDIV